MLLCLEALMSSTLLSSLVGFDCAQKHWSLPHYWVPYICSVYDRWSSPFNRFIDPEQYCTLKDRIMRPCLQDSLSTYDKQEYLYIRTMLQYSIFSFSIKMLSIVFWS